MGGKERGTRRIWRDEKKPALCPKRLICFLKFQVKLKGEDVVFVKVETSSGLDAPKREIGEFSLTE